MNPLPQLPPAPTSLGERFPLPTSTLGARVDAARHLLRSLPTQTPVLAFSGGKDSTVLAHLCRSAGLRPQLIYHVTTIDPPEVVRFARAAGAWFDHPGSNYARLIAVHGLPTMWRRWCCRIFKHGRTFADVTLLGVRAAESYRRRQSWKSELQPTARGLLVLPLLFWEDTHVWQYINDNRLPLCELYAQGYARVGCIGCPLVRGSRLRDFPRWPKFAAQVQSGYAQMVERNHVPNPSDYWNRWINDQFTRPNHHAECTGVALWANV